MPLLFLLGPPFRSQRLCLLPSSCCFTVILLGVEVLNTNAHPQVTCGAVFLASAIYTHYNKDMMIWKLTTMLTDWYYSTYFIQLKEKTILTAEWWWWWWYFDRRWEVKIYPSAKKYAIQPNSSLFSHFETAFLYHTPVPSEIQRFVKSAAYVSDF